MRAQRSAAKWLTLLLAGLLMAVGLLGTGACSQPAGGGVSSSSSSPSSALSASNDSFDLSAVSWGAPLATAYGDVGEAARSVAPDAVLVSASTVAPVSAGVQTPLWVYLFESFDDQCVIAVTQSGGAYQAGFYSELALTEEQYAAAEDLSGALDAEEAFRLAEPLIAGRPVVTCEAFVLAAASDQEERGAMSDQTGQWFFVFNSGYSREDSATPGGASSDGADPRAFTIAVNVHDGNAFEV